MRSCGFSGLTNMLIIAGHLKVRESDRDRYVADCAEAVIAARSADGCLDFAVSPDAVDPSRVNIFERWRTRELLLAFRGEGPDDDLRSRILEANVAEYDIA
jgi:quinol monooxygenase YgiN